eukprot:TRINITY_DN26365_c0_g1_i1.p2 TRINITY_DN26365_c0_g1~~TRINITY_DN26365_c0_g1_i1.p2  ORF type:complete len:447 (+),score=177.28 TRINITY_DN26365_c0_g1_i1:53-1393(+)
MRRAAAQLRPLFTRAPMGHADPQSVRGVGELACQRDSFLRTLDTTVARCVPARDFPQAAEWIKNAELPPGAAAPADWWCVQLADTPLFAEGGGQPSDTGRIGDALCANVQRVGMEVWHLCDKAVEPGAAVAAAVDWDRRWDHMQQHSGQHLLTAVVESELGLETASWSLGKELCNIQLGVNTLARDQIDRVERICNEHIRKAAEVSVSVISDKEQIREFSTRSSRGIPEDVTGAIRLVHLPGVDRSTCCGTHVRLLSDLQLIRVLHFEPKGNTMRLFFVVGDRALRQSAQMYDRERALVKAVGTAPEDLVAAVERIKKSAADSKKAHAAALKDLAPLLGAAAAAAHDPAAGKAFFLHRDDADMGFLMTVCDKFAEQHPGCLAVLSFGDRRQGGEGQLLIAGPEDKLAAAAQKAVELTQAKGGINKGRWRGKMPSLKKLKDLEKAGL